MHIREALDRYQDCMSNKISHQDYFETIALSAGLNEYDLPFTLDQVRKALNEGDVHLNTLPLKLWHGEHDYIVCRLRHCSGIGKFSWSISGTVSTLKCLAIYLATR